MKLHNRTLLMSSALTLFLVGCSSTQKIDSNFESPSSYLRNTSEQVDVVNAELIATESPEEEHAVKYKYIPPFKLNQTNLKTAEDILHSFDASNSLTISADELPLADYLHQVMGEQLKVSYVIDDDVKQSSNPVTLNLQEKISSRKLFTLTEKLLSERNYVIRYNDGIYYIHKKEEGQSKNLVYGYGKKPQDVPQTSLDVYQIVPFDYGLQASLANTLRVLMGISAQADVPRGVMTIQGKRQDILRALDLIALMDRPSLYEREVGAYKSSFIDTKSAVSKLKDLLAEEGIVISTNGSGRGRSTLSVVEIENQGVLIFFATQQTTLDRAMFWLSQIDKPLQTTEMQYFLYQPQFSRAADLGVSLEALIGSDSGRSSATSIANENTANSQPSGVGTVRSASSDGLKMVVDERSNTIIFHTSGERYQQIVPLIKKLDVLPKQIMLEVIIAEVTLTDEFKKGVEFALNNGNYGLGTSGAFMGEGFGGLSYLVNGADGNIQANLFKSNSLVNILSRPTLVVRDGVAASISVGTDIPIVGKTTSDPLGTDKQTTEVEYRKTGVELGVTPTVNAQGVVLMAINQKISNQVEVGTTSAINPSVFERTINTEVVAESGQTIILGGLISDNRTKKETKVPILGDLPILGHLFRANTDSGDKTELVVLVTPRVIHNQSEWSGLKQQFQKSLENLSFNESEN
ncbi:secretin N-terminal domain-containing protein [Pseudoalteromonas aurantia]|uniref:General secretion pathway protein D n=1 Tax=Pseudoalteromonas aurantia 208 TaxID=1314867 RepID=A0ABR9EGD4_9GAMM|nr:secretin N-terminal domain-containing protein [Pseudoalteromonas aurantia]MBE0369290.1 general secretion pathway protein D [Pseudoalteromonas aurantia 208]